MSITKRLIAGSAASWFQIGITILSQILLVPIYLSTWDVTTYGIWIAIQALISILSTLDLGHQTFLGFEFLRIGQNNKSLTSKTLWSGVWMGLIVGIFQVLLIVGLILSGFFKFLLVEKIELDQTLVKDAGWVLLLTGIVWMITGSAGGIFVRVLTAFNYYSRLAWWGVFASTITAVAPALAVALGANLFLTGVAAAAATLFFNVFLYFEIFRLLRKEEIRFNKGSFKLGYKNLLQSLIISMKNLLENARIVGVRVILAPLSGAQSLVAFTTIRTGANFAMQGLHSITNPMMPELMKFLHQRDQQRSETAFGTIWIIIVAFMAPGVVILQTIIAPLFSVWTRNKIIFDPLLFAILSISVLIYALSQPAIAVVTGNNLLKSQLYLSAISAFIMVVTMGILVPRIGIVGAGLALLAAEYMAMFGYRREAIKWLNNNGLKWPNNSYNLAARSVLIAAIATAAITYCPSWKWILLTASLLLMLLNLQKYWFSLPEFARIKSVTLLKSINA
jgi:O-antigen/teichoic acid export membrane protein